MKVEASVDLGSNLTSLLERLAQQLGTTADKVFPWYVAQAQIEGVTALWAIGIFLGLALLGFVASVAAALVTKSEGVGTVAGFFGFVFIAGMLVGSIEGVEAVRKMTNPNYYAMTMLTRDIGRLTR